MLQCIFIFSFIFINIFIYFPIHCRKSSSQPGNCSTSSYFSLSPFHTAFYCSFLTDIQISVATSQFLLGCLKRVGRWVLILLALISSLVCIRGSVNINKYNFQLMQGSLLAFFIYYMCL